MDEILQDISKAVAAIGRIDGAPTSGRITRHAWRA
jgi:hypothetical protein